MIDWIRIIAVALVFGLIWQFAPDFIKGWVLGVALVSLALKMEES
jgi:hypothetical protein